jgi:hypothetical protein
MDDFSIFSSSFQECLHCLTLVLVRCKEKKVDLISNLPPLRTVKEIRSFIGPCRVLQAIHQGFQ